MTMELIDELKLELAECDDCGAQPGEYHVMGCDRERCPRCGGQLLLCLMCRCPESMPEEHWPPALDDRLPWTGYPAGVMECRQFGWFAKRHLFWAGLHFVRSP